MNGKIKLFIKNSEKAVSIVNFIFSKIEIKPKQRELKKKKKSF